MPRDHGLEELLNDDLAGIQDLIAKPMFGGWVWLLRGNLLCGARHDGMLARIGKQNETWALALPEVVPMISRGRTMSGWVRIDTQTYGDDMARRRLLDAALEFNRLLRAK